MWSQDRCRWHACRWAAVISAGCITAAGCKSDLNQQLLERELRYQEDQIYQLQDELQQKCARLDSLAGENTSLRRQLGVGEGDQLTRSRPARGRPGAAAGAAPIAVPPAIEVPEAIRGPAAPGVLAPPALDNIPPLPVKPSSAPAAEPMSLPAPADAAKPAAPRPVAVPVAYDQPLADGRPVRLVVIAAATGCVDADGDGTSEGLNVTVEPRDADERLVPATGAVSITAFDSIDPATPLAAWTIPAEQAATHFRRTTRLRGMHFPLRWTGTPPTGDHVRVVVRITGPEAAVLETDAMVPTH